MTVIESPASSRTSLNMTPVKSALASPSPRSTVKRPSIHEKDLKIHELQAENALLEKEVVNYRKEATLDTKRFEEQMKSLLSDNARLLDLNRALEDKLSIITKDKVELSLGMQSVKTQFKDVTAERDKMEREFSKEVSRLENANSILSDKNSALTRDRIDLQNQLVLVSKRLKDSEAECVRFERDAAKENRGGDQMSIASSNSLKIKENEVRKLTRANQIAVAGKESAESALKASLKNLEAVKETVKDLENRLDDAQQENQLLAMKVTRLEVSHGYACQLEEELEQLRKEHVAPAVDEVTSKLEQLSHD